MNKARKSLLVISFILLITMPFMLAAAPGQEVEPPGDAMELLTSLLDPVISLAGKIVVIVFGLAVFLLGTVQGTNVVKFVLAPKIERWDWYIKARPSLIRVLSFLVAVFLLVGSNVDFFGILSSISAVYEVDPIFAQVITGGTLSFAANWFYDSKIDETAKG